MSPSLYLQHRRIFVFAVSRIADDAVYKPVASVVGRHKIAAKTRQPFPQRHFPSSQLLTSFH